MVTFTCLLTLFALSINLQKINGAARVSVRVSSYRASSYRASSYRASSYRVTVYQSSVSSFRSSTRTYKTAAILSGTLYMSRRYNNRYYNNDNYDPTICENYVTPLDENTMPLDENGTMMYDNRTVYGLFVCPLDEISDKVYCCGSDMQQYCCTFWDDPGRLIGVIIGILIFISLLFVGFWLAHRFIKRKKTLGVVVVDRLNVVSPTVTNVTANNGHIPPNNMFQSYQLNPSVPLDSTLQFYPTVPPYLAAPPEQNYSEKQSF